MSKILQDKHLTKRPGARSLLAVTLTLTLAAFGCTTDRTLGNGDPVMTPGMRTAPTSGVSSGSESSAVPPPMISSSTYPSQTALPRVQSRDIRRLSPDEAAAIMADQQPSVKVLGPAMPGRSGRGYESDGIRTGQFINPAMLTNPTPTVNSSVTSDPIPVISSGAGEAVSGGGAIVSGTTVTSSAVAPGSAAVINTGGATVTPTNASIPLPPGAFATTTLTPTAASVVNATPTISASPTLAATRGTTSTRNTATTRTTAAPTNNTSATATAVTTAGTVTVVPVRLTTDANGRTVMTNAPATTGTARTATPSTRRQQ